MTDPTPQRPPARSESGPPGIVDRPTGEVPRGRPVRLEPTPAGLWRVLLGVGVAALAPLFGFLIGGAMGSARPGANDPMVVALFLGIVVGGIGVLVALNGGMRLWRTSRDKRLAAEQAEAAAATSDTAPAP